MNAVTALLLGCFLVPPYGMEQNISHSVSVSIINSGYRRVGVLPRFLVRQQGREVLGGSIGPQADLLAEQLEESLIQAAQGKFRVVDGRQMRRAFEKLSIDDLGNPAVLRRMAEGLGGLEGLVVCTVTDQRSGRSEEERAPLMVQARLIDLRDGSVAGTGREDVFLSLSDAAYMGESWELRRWVGNQLQIVGLRSDRSGDRDSQLSLYGDGDLYERMHYSQIRRDRPHPLANPDCPYRLAVAVNEQERPLVRIGDRMYVTLDPGDVYWIRAQNKLPRPVYLTVFVDGVNILGKQREPLSRARYWFLRPEYTSNLKGWYTGTEGNYKQEEFVVAPADDSVAAGQGFGQQLGMITAVFHTVGMEGIPKAHKIAAAMMPGSFGTGAGRESRVRMEEVAGPKPGLILAAMTIYYVTQPRLEELQRGGGSSGGSGGSGPVTPRAQSH